VRVVLDTNIWVAGAARPEGVTGAILLAWFKEKRFTLLTSKSQVKEFRSVTKYAQVRKILGKKEAGALVNRVKKLAEFVPVRGIKKFSPDPDDDFIIAIATQGKANHLVSRNKIDLLDLGVIENVRIVTPEQFLRFLRRGRLN
jgi:uncharacterized protein